MPRRITFERSEEYVTVTIWEGDVSPACITMSYEEFDAFLSYGKIYRNTNAVSSTFVLVSK